MLVSEGDVVDAALWKHSCLYIARKASISAAVIAAIAGGIDDHQLIGLGIFELHHAVVGNVTSASSDVKQNHVMSPVSQAAEGLKDGARIGQQVGEDHHQAAVPEHGRNLRQALGRVSRPRRLSFARCASSVRAASACFLAASLSRTRSSNVIRPTGSC